MQRTVRVVVLALSIILIVLYDRGNNALAATSTATMTARPNAIPIARYH